MGLIMAMTADSSRGQSGGGQVALDLACWLRDEIPTQSPVVFCGGGRVLGAKPDGEEGCGAGGERGQGYSSASRALDLVEVVRQLLEPQESRSERLRHVLALLDPRFRVHLNVCVCVRARARARARACACERSRVFGHRFTCTSLMLLDRKQVFIHGYPCRCTAVTATVSRDLARACREYLNAKGGTGVDEVGALLPQVKLALLRMDAGAGAWGGQGEVGTRRLRGYGVESGCNVGDLLRVYHRLD